VLGMYHSLRICVRPCYCFEQANWISYSIPSVVEFTDVSSSSDSLRASLILCLMSCRTQRLFLYLCPFCALQKKKNQMNILDLQAMELVRGLASTLFHGTSEPSYSGRIREDYFTTSFRFGPSISGRRTYTADAWTAVVVQLKEANIFRILQIRLLVLLRSPLGSVFLGDKRLLFCRSWKQWWTVNHVRYVASS
jgi:hypothetical protein